VIAENLVHFARVLRGAGLTIGPDRVLSAIAAIEAVGVDRRDDVRTALAAVMIDRHEQQPIFEAAFEAFWRDPKLLERLMHLMLPKVQGRADKPVPRPGRLQEALAPPRSRTQDGEARQDEIRFEAELSFSDRERLQQADFESMTMDEFEAAQRLAREIAVPVDPVKRRRHEAAPRGRLDLRATMLRMARSPHTLAPAFTQPREEMPPLVVLLDISGSMDRYARVFLHYAHSLMQRLPHVHVLTFGTRLTDITRCLRDRDPDVALKRADERVSDWKGGTRIASSLDAFNRLWARRLLGGNAAVLLVTDGLDRDEGGRLGAAAARLRRMAHRVVWLNPLLRFDGFEPRASGVRALLPQVDRMLPVHNLQSLADLGRALRHAHARAGMPGW
jgi:uncharacterized protein with von Willebrand factor type A (vWA) domain